VANDSGGRLEGIQLAAQLGGVGLNPLEFLDSKDPVRIMLMRELAEKLAEEKKMWNEQLAVSIANAVGKAFGG